jgi:glycopeptide antibiotics resistance protein
MFTEAAIEILTKNWPMLFIFVTMIVTLRLAYIFSKKRKLVFYEEVLGLGFLIYVLSLFYAVTFQDVTWSTSNFRPFQEIMRYELWSPKFMKNVIGNMIVFIPYGFYVSYLLKLSKKRFILLLTFVTSLTIEITQLSIGRVFDIDDLMLNLIGGLMGFYLYRILHNLKEKLPRFLKHDLFYNVIVVILLGILIWYIYPYLKVGM